MIDGLYQVTTPYLCAGFVIAGGQVTLCAPILRKKLSYWMTVAKLVSDSDRYQCLYQLSGAASSGWGD